MSIWVDEGRIYAGCTQQTIAVWDKEVTPIWVSPLILSRQENLDTGSHALMTKTDRFFQWMVSDPIWVLWAQSTRFLFIEIISMPHFTTTFMSFQNL